MNFKKLESGRSMVEMLGVLAIIGVLSVGGIAGYSLSMRRHRANQIADIVSKLALFGYNTCQQLISNGDAANVSECDLNKIPGAWDLTAENFGGLPAGVHAFGFEKIESDPTTGIDTITIDVAFRDNKLCQAFASVAGKPCEQNNVYIQIKQN